MVASPMICQACKAALAADPPPGAKCPECGTPIPIPPTSGHLTLDLGPSGHDTTNPTLDPAPRSGNITITLGDSTPVGSSGGPGPREFPFLAPPKEPNELGRLGPYRVLGVLGRGGMGAVFRAEDSTLRRQVALKVMLPDVAASPVDAARFLREARAQAAVEHDHVAAIFQVGEDRGVPFIAMPMLKGESLAAALRSSPRFAVAEAVRVAREMAEGLAAAHEKGLIHRDIKPGNVWLEGRQRRVKILDFGLARVTADSPALAGDSGPTTQSGYVVGTPAYMSPEQARGAPLDARSDLFSLGTVLYRMLTGEEPFRGNTPTELLIVVATEDPPPPASLDPRIPPELNDLTMRLLAKKPSMRPASAEEAAGQLRLIEAGLGVAGPVPAPPHPLQVPGQGAGRGAPATPPLAAPVSSTVTATPASQAARRGAPPRLLVGSLLAFLVAVVVAAQVVIKIKNKDGTETEIKAPEGSTVTVTRGGKEVARVGPEERKEPAKALDERAAAEYAIMLGGKVRVNDKNGENNDIAAVADLPKGQFRLTTLILSNVRWGNDGLAPFADCVNLKELHFSQTETSDADLAYFKKCVKLRYVSLDVTRITDDGLAFFKGSESLEQLFLNMEQIGDAGLAHLKDCKNLRELWADGSKVTDAGLRHLKDCKKLRTLNVCNNRITPAGATWVKENLPDCAFRRVKDGAPDPFNDSIAAARALALGGRVDVTNPATPMGAISAEKDLPQPPFTLTGLHLNGSRATDDDLAAFKDCKELLTVRLTSLKAITDAGLAHFKGHAKLTQLHLGGTQVTDDGLANLKGCASLRYVGLAETRVTDAGLAHLKNCKDLTTLLLRATPVTDKGMEHFAGRTGVKHLDVGETAVGDAGLKAFRGCTQMQKLQLAGSQVTDAGLAPFLACKDLILLDVSKTRVTPEKVKEFVDSLPKCKVLSDGGTVEPREK